MNIARLYREDCKAVPGKQKQRLMVTVHGYRKGCEAVPRE